MANDQTLHITIDFNHTITENTCLVDILYFFNFLMLFYVSNEMSTFLFFFMYQRKCQLFSLSFIFHYYLYL